MRARVSAELSATGEGQHELDIRLELGQFASPSQLEHLLSISRRVDVEPGHVLFKRGDPTHHVVQVMSGEVELRSPTSPTWTIADSGTAGMLDLMRSRLHARTGVATTPVRILEVDAEDYRDYLEDNFDVSLAILARLSSELAVQMTNSDHAARLYEIAITTGSHPRFGDVEIPIIERMMLLSRMEIFATASRQALATLGQRAAEGRFSPGDVIAAAGESPNVVTILVEGSVDLTAGGRLVAQRNGRGLLAHVEELSAAPRLTTATAATPVITLQVEREELLDRMEEHFDLALSLFHFLAEGQERMNDFLAAAGQPLGAGWK